MAHDVFNSLEETTELNLQFEKRNGILPVIVQESISGHILMLGYTNRETFEMTLSSGIATFWSTSRQKIWIKGQTSGNTMLIDKILIDCDQDAVIYQVALKYGGACHTISTSGQHRKACFYREYDGKSRLQFIENTK